METLQQILRKSNKINALLIALVLSASFLFVFFTSLTIIPSRVTIYDVDTVYSRYTVYTTAEEIIADQDIVLADNDIYRFSGFEDRNATLEILRAFDVTVEADGKSETFILNEGTVADALVKANVTLGENDLINISEDEKLVNDTTITVDRVTYNTYTEESEIPFETETPEMTDSQKNDDDINISIDIAGQNGVLLTEYKDTLVNGEVSQTDVISETITKEPVTQVMQLSKSIYVGSRKVEYALDDVPVELDANGIPVNYTAKVTGKATAYSALGRPTSLTPGAVAMDLSKYPKGTKLYVVSTDGSYVYGYSVVRDTGTAVSNGSVLVDCFFNTYKESCQFGAKQVTVYVLN